MRNRYIYIGAFLLFIFYTLFFTIKTGKEYILAPRQVIGSSYYASDFSGAESSVIGFELADAVGFIAKTDNENRPLSYHLLPKNDRVSVSPSALIIYNGNETKKEIVLGSNLSQKSCISTGWPLQLSGRLFFYDAAGSSIEERDLQGNLLWERDLNSFLTAISATEDLLLLGTVDGSCFLFDKTGAETLSYTPEFEGFAVIAGAVLSKDGTTMAVASGTDPQKLEVFRLTEDDKQRGLDLLYTEDLANSAGHPIKMFFDDYSEELQLLFESQGGLRELCVDTSVSSDLAYFGELSRLSVDPLTGYRTFLSGTSDKGNISIYTVKEGLIYQEFFEANFRSIGELDNYSFFSLDNTLLIVEKIYE